ncbi:ArsR family transcriptional regulator [Saccharothrix saharensis]|uniref:ArsR family transcriptional regulator n=1 Tax=Saccharothrix saharensis TaxID=571190 RepID=A0A543JRN4_9PSEU|nr:MarR family transcriptional regulator [Saccharothrix saharensis]TQM85513.1 ArsR family transcriptional regulator [Saccharothrix saharensis]
MLHVHLSAADMWRTRLAVWGPLAETQWSMRALQRGDRADLLGAWRSRLRSVLAGDLLDVMSALAPADGPVIDLFTLIGPVRELDEGLALLVARYPELPEPVRRRFPGGGRVLADSLRAYHLTAVGPQWSRIRRALRSEQARHSTVMAVEGIGAMLNRLHPAVRWRPPVLTVAGRASGDVPLGGRGLVLAGSLFSGPDVPVLVPSEPSRPPLLVYPVGSGAYAEARLWATPGGAGDALRTLLGTTRANVLAAIADRSPGTADLARELGISPSGASQHAAVLRRAGLITTERVDQAVRHAVTALGASLLDRAFT